MRTLIIAEHDHQSLKSSTYHAVGAGLKITDSVDVIIIGSACQEVAEEAASLPHVETVLVADHMVYEHQLAENTAALISECLEGYTHVLVPATTFGKNLLPRVAALLDLGMMGDVIQILSPDTFVRPIYAGNVYATVVSEDSIKLLTVRGTAFPAMAGSRESKAAIQAITTVIPNHLSQFKHQTLTITKRPELTAARVIISGGRGLKSADNFKLLEAIADRLGAAIGASRAAVDAGFAPNDYQVGQTGKVVAPDLYIAVGISGAIQHLAGMKDSKVIVAINSDPDAPIFEAADYGLVGDLFTILPELRDEIDRVIPINA